MCGISGYFSRLKELDLGSALQASLDSQKHRGPDAHGIWQDAYAGLAHARLAIIDLSPLGDQPMHLQSEKLHLVFNGEIYNYTELKKELQDLGCHFTSDSDTEVILWAYAKWGSKAFARFNGMFALAIYHSEKKELILARDRYGIKPLYHFIDDQYCFFASELGSLLSFPIRRKLDHLSLQNYFQFSYIPDDRTMISNVSQLKPGTFKRIGDKSCIEEAYYSIAERQLDISYQDAIDEIKVKLHQSVKRRLIADVPVATFLSSGVDSSIITAIAAEQHAGISAFSAGFSEFPFFNEAPLAKEWSKKLDVQHHIIDLKEADLLSASDEILRSYSEPFADSSAIAYYLLSKHVAQDVKVVLSGDGADELFGGYRKHKAEWMFRNHPRLGRISGKLSSFIDLQQGNRNSGRGNIQRQLAKWIEASKLNAEERYVLMASISSRQELSDLLLKPSTAWYHAPELASFNDVLKQDMEMVLRGDMLYKVDRSSMAHGLEVRVPFLDHELVDFVFSLPSEWKLKKAKRKVLLKDAFKQEIPREILERKKKGFEVPLGDWLRGPLKNYVDELLNDKKIREQGLFNSEALKEQIDKSRRMDAGNAPQIVWAMLVFQQWMQSYNPEI